MPAFWLFMALARSVTDIGEVTLIAGVVTPPIVKEMDPPVAATAVELA
jgi:hypothetical protein